MSSKTTKGKGIYSDWAKRNSREVIECYFQEDVLCESLESEVRLMLEEQDECPVEVLEYILNNK